MAVRIRLKRMGKIHAPFYRVVVVDSRKKRDGRVIEEIGIYNPMPNPSEIQIESERALYWLGVGAQPSDQVKRLLDLTGDWAKFKGAKNTESRVKYRDAEAAAKAAEAAVKAAEDEAEKRKAAKSAEEAEAKAAAEAAQAEEAAEETAEAPEAEAPAEEA